MGGRRHTTVYDLIWTNLPQEEWPVDGKSGVWCSWEMACLLGREFAEKRPLKQNDGFSWLGVGVWMVLVSL